MQHIFSSSSVLFVPPVGQIFLPDAVVSISALIVVALLATLAYTFSIRRRLEHRMRVLEENLKASRDLEEQSRTVRDEQERHAAVIRAELTTAREDLKAHDAERRRAEIELQRKAEEFRVVFNSVPALIWIKDQKNRILRVNQRAAEALGLSIQEVEGKHTAEFYPDEAEQYYRDDLEVIQRQKAKLGIIEPVQSQGGNKRWIQTDKVPFLDASGNVAGIIVFAQDITERKQLEESMQQAQRVDSIGRLAGGVAHDFNNMLAAILGLSELARASISSESEAAHT